MSSLLTTNLKHPSSASNNIVLDSSGNIAVQAGTAGAPAIQANGDSNTGIYFPAADNIGFTTGGTIRGRWTTDGLCFNADTAAANALDDYEEGTWTPTVTPASGSITAYTSSGTYTKIGRTVVCQLRVTTTTIGTASGYLEVTNLPFSADLSTVSMFAGYGRDVSTGFTLSVEHYSALKALWQKYDGTFLGANGKIFTITLVYLV